MASIINALVINERFQCEPTKCLEYSRDMTKTAESGGAGEDGSKNRPQHQVSIAKKDCKIRDYPQDKDLVDNLILCQNINRLAKQIC